mmetsp:Transcript_877/g.2114  ORF Transcript_877/g.2114 Transcript_877/m.2114 type:complete len:611 (-) Transcript_877:1041-2873(-)
MDPDTPHDGAEKTGGGDGHDDSCQEWEDRKPSPLPDSDLPKSVAVDSRSFSSQKSDQGDHSPGDGALSDGGPPSHSAPSRQQGEVGSSTMSSARSVGSVGSFQEGISSYRIRDIASHIVHGETRFPTATSYAHPEAPKSDIATVCSGSVVEDIDQFSVDMPQHQSERVTSTITSSTPRRSGSGGSTRAVEFAETSSTIGESSSSFSHLHRKQPPTTGTAGTSSVNDMGPPLSRALLMQRDQQTTGMGGTGSIAGSVAGSAAGSVAGSVAGSTAGSRAGSVRSFGSRGSVVAHVDTDDCGGSLLESGAEDLHSLHSQDDTKGEKETTQGGEGVMDLDHHKEDDNKLPSSLVQSTELLEEHSSSGRTSPGGTIYKGRGVRRYQGRYMHLPLRRFHQSGPDAGVSLDDTMQDGTSREDMSDRSFSHHHHDLYDPRRRQHEYDDGRWDSRETRRFRDDREEGRSRDDRAHRSMAHSRSPASRQGDYSHSRRRSRSHSAADGRQHCRSRDRGSDDDMDGGGPRDTRRDRRRSRRQETTASSRSRSQSVDTDRSERSRSRSHSQSPRDPSRRGRWRSRRYESRQRGERHRDEYRRGNRSESPSRSRQKHKRRHRGK